ncbi:nuclear RNA export factor 1 isoform X1 [Phaenicophaeus curvirostris]|uniref:nuclear RNA export factor 1 isoform X1 n=1 Tax=Phaenicophaeus curvirostris TaxID=33595 RepID=UPI0037F0ABED
MAEDGKGGYSEHDDRVGGRGFSGRRRKGRGPFRGKMYSEGNHRPRSRGGSDLRPRPEEDDGDVPMSEAHEGPRGRYLPYGPRPNRNPNLHITVRRDGNAERSGGTSREGGRRNWFKITIPYGKKYDKSWLLSSIQNLCSVPFTPVEFHYDHNRAQFYVEDATTASALKQVSRKITDRDNYKVVIIINSSAPPQSLQNELKPEEIEQLKLCMSKRYDGSQRALDLKSLRVDPDLVARSIDAVLNQRSCMQAVLRIIEENIPELQSLNLSSNKLYRLDDLSELSHKAAGLRILDLSRNELKSDRELDKVKGLKLEELWLDGNPLCDAFRDQASYIRSVPASRGLPLLRRGLKIHGRIGARPAVSPPKQLVPSPPPAPGSPSLNPESRIPPPGFEAEAVPSSAFGASSILLQLLGAPGFLPPPPPDFLGIRSECPHSGSGASCFSPPRSGISHSASKLVFQRIPIPIFFSSPSPVLRRIPIPIFFSSPFPVLRRTPFPLFFFFLEHHNSDLQSIPLSLCSPFSHFLLASNFFFSPETPPSFMLPAFLLGTPHFLEAFPLGISSLAASSPPHPAPRLLLPPRRAGAGPARPSSGCRMRGRRRSGIYFYFFVPPLSGAASRRSVRALDDGWLARDG